MSCRITSKELDLKSLLRTLIEYNGGENFHIEAVYLFGSRLYGIANRTHQTDISGENSSSDYDFIIITNRKVDQHRGINNNNRLPSNSRLTLELVCGENQMDCVVMDVSHFLMDVFIEQHNYKSILPLWLENGCQYVWFESNLMRLIRTYWMALLNIRLRQIQRGLTLWCKITAKRSFNDGDLRRARKNLLHSIRYLKYAIHIVNDKKISKYRNAKKYYELFFERTREFKVWKEYEELFRPVHQLFKSRLNDGCYQLFKDSQSASNDIMLELTKKPTPSTVFLEYSKKYGIMELPRHFSIVVSPLFESMNEKKEKQKLRICQQDPPSALSLIDGSYQVPQDLSIVDIINRESFISTKLVKIITHREVHKRLDDLIPLQECWNGSIVQMQPPSDWNHLQPDCTNLKLIAQPYNYFFQYDSDACDNILLRTSRVPVEEQTIQVTRKYVGTMCLLFYHDNEWLISTNHLSKDWEFLYGRVDPSLNENDTQSAFWKVFQQCGYSLPEDSTKCFMFTLSSPPFLREDTSECFTRELIAHGCRDMTTMKEEWIQPHAERYGWKYPEIIEIIPKGPYFDIIEKTKYQPKKRSLNTNLWRKKPDDICVNLPLFQIFEKYMELSNDFSTMNPEKHSGFVLCDQDFVRVKVETSIYYNMSYLEIFRDSETQETSVDSENNQMYIIEMIRNLKSFLSEGVEHIVKSGGNLKILSSELSIDLKLVKYHVPEFFNLYVEYRNLYQIACNLMNIVYSQLQQDLKQQIHDGTLKEEDISKVYPDMVKKYSPISRTFPLMYMRKHQIDNCFNLFTRKNHLHTEAIHGFLAECRQKMDKILPFLINSLVQQ